MEEGTLKLLNLSSLHNWFYSAGERPRCVFFLIHSGALIDIPNSQSERSSVQSPGLDGGKGGGWGLQNNAVFHC